MTTPTESDSHHLATPLETSHPQVITSPETACLDVITLPETSLLEITTPSETNYPNHSEVNTLPESIHSADIVQERKGANMSKLHPLLAGELNDNQDR